MFSGSEDGNAKIAIFLRTAGRHGTRLQNVPFNASDFDRHPAPPTPTARGRFKPADDLIRIYPYCFTRKIQDASRRKVVPISLARSGLGSYGPPDSAILFI
jgi:hypothetical protein